MIMVLLNTCFLNHYPFMLEKKVFPFYVASKDFLLCFYSKAEPKMFLQQPSLEGGAQFWPCMFKKVKFKLEQAQRRTNGMTGRIESQFRESVLGKKIKNSACFAK